MTVTRVLGAARLIKPTRRRGFCPACRGWVEGTADRPGHVVSELSPPGLIALAFLVVAAVAWVWTIRQAGGAGGMEMGLGSLGSFATGWTVTMTAMMLPSALPLVYGFARRSEGRRRWRAATAALAATYLSVWLGFGLACYVVLTAFPVPTADQGAVGGIALALAGVYGLMPIKAAGEARCRELCSLHGSLPFSVMGSAVIAGGRYGLSCIGCSAGLMVAMAVIGMASVAWMLVVAGMVLAYKLAPAPSVWRTWTLSAALIGMAVVYVSMA